MDNNNTISSKMNGKIMGFDNKIDYTDYSPDYSEI